MILNIQINLIIKSLVSPLNEFLKLIQNFFFIFIYF